MEKEYHMVYNPFILKLIHSKSYYLDKLLTVYLPIFSQLKHDIMRNFIISNYHVKMIIRDIILLYRCSEEETYSFDIYLCNFEYFMYRLTEQYIKRDIDHDSAIDGLFPCESVMRQYVTQEKKEELIATLIKRYISRIYFDRNTGSGISSKNDTIYKDKITERVRLLFNIKNLIEDDIINKSTDEDEILHYDKVAIMGLLCVYFINEFISDMSRTRNKKNMNILNCITKEKKESNIVKEEEDPYINLKNYIQSKSNVVTFNDIENISIHENNKEREEEEESYRSDMSFLVSLRLKIINTLVVYIHGWCIKEKQYMNESNQDSIRIEDIEERKLRLHDEKYNKYFSMKSTATNKKVYNIPEYKRFLNNNNNNIYKSVYETKFLDIYGNEKFYESITFAILFNLRLNTKHPNCKDKELLGTCNICNYMYINSQIADFNKKCHSYNYNKIFYFDNNEKDRIIFDKYLKFTVIEIIPTFNGHLFRMLYNIILLLYHTDIILTEEYQRCSKYDLFLMINTSKLYDNIQMKDFFSDLETKLEKIIIQCRTLNNTKHEHEHEQEKEQQQQRVINNNKTKSVMKERESVRKLAFDMELLIKIISNIDKQCETIKKYERSTNKNISSTTTYTYTMHTQIIGFMKKIYIYYVRQLCSLLQ